MPTSRSDHKLVEWFFGLKRFAQKLHDKAIDVAAPISPAPEPEPEKHWSSTSEGHTKMLASLVCECGRPKEPCWFRCVQCHEEKRRSHE